MCLIPDAVDVSMSTQETVKFCLITHTMGVLMPDQQLAKFC